MRVESNKLEFPAAIKQAREENTYNKTFYEIDGNYNPTVPIQIEVNTAQQKLETKETTLWIGIIISGIVLLIFLFGL